ncbi:membrane protein [Leucobacter sp. UCD-THU]|uniref:choice-of-anchor M domain-containing protein n=1 Tax=Leucobacter sp. UCD-THU TaxID=1292023 RepID=UPI000377171C|nr:choice-of-anchor M domain-containing protein [Leucobacter sp. UCD-THU]EYT56812.1 membrane protein [Leucobacter sp. UCD-THU]
MNRRIRGGVRGIGIAALVVALAAGSLGASAPAFAQDAAGGSEAQPAQGPSPDPSPETSAEQPLGDGERADPQRDGETGAGAEVEAADSGGAAADTAEPPAAPGVRAPVGATAPATAAAPTLAEATPFADQSDQPAPASRAKQVIGNVHTDTVSGYLDDGRLVLEAKYDSPAGQKAIRIDPQATVFHLVDTTSSRMQVPSGGRYGFIGEAGDTFWLAPQTQNAALIWPGFSTEDERLVGQLRGGSVAVRLLGVDGPGKAEVYLQETFGPKRVFSSSERLADWSMGVPQHTHMNWAFTETGTYTFTFEMEAVIGGSVQRAQNDYTFVVGDLDDHTAATATSFSAEYSEDAEGNAVLGEPVTFTATVDSAGARSPAGAVQFRDDESGTVLGHAPVGADGTASFRTSALASGPHRIVAEFVPTWSTDFTASESEQMTLTVSGEAQPRPEHDDVDAVPAAEVRAVAAGAHVQVRNPEKTVRAGEVVAGAVSAEALRGGDWVSVWLHTPDPVWLGWVRTGTDGGFTEQVPARTAAGTHALVLKDAAGAFLGWDEVRVTGQAGGPEPGGGDPGGDPGGGNPGGGGGPGGGSTPGGGSPGGGGLPVPVPAAPTQECVPEVVLETGHIDAFNVAAADGQAVLQLKEDVTGLNVIREAESVLLRVKESAYGAVPPGIAGAPAQGYVLPLSQDPDLIWPGWNTLGFTEASGYTNVSINVVGVDGPGRIFLATQDSLGAWSPIMDGFAMPGTIRVPHPAHTHAAWVFSAKGNYKLTVNATATSPATGRTLTTETHTYMFQVGDVELGDAFCGVAVDPNAAAAGLAVGSAVKQAGSKAVAASKAKNADAAAKKSGKSRSAAAAGADGSGSGGPGALLGAGMHPAAVAGVVGGGLLMLSGIIGGTVWYVRRLGSASAATASAAVPA